MNRRRLGRTDLSVSELVFGGGWVGGILIDADDETRIEALNRAYRAGVNWIDTAPMYGQGVSETTLGRLLSEVDTEAGNPLMLSTKVRIDLDGLDDIAGHIERSVHESFERLKVDRVELMQLHNALAEETDGEHLGVDAVLRDGGVADVFDRLRGEGLFEHIGFTALGQTPALARVVDSGRFDTGQVYYNMLNSSSGRRVSNPGGVQDYEQLMSLMTRHDMGVLLIRVFAAGVIATDTRTGREIMVAEGTDVGVDEARARAVFAQIGDEFGTRAQTAIRYALANTQVGGIVLGLASLDHLDEALEAATLGPLSTAAVNSIDSIIDNLS